MTPTPKTPQAQPKEYIIAESDMEELADYANAEEAESCIRHICDTIRTRPHTPAPEQCKHWVSSANLKSDCRDQDIGRFYCNKSMYEHDAIIAAQAREKVLDLIQDHNNGRITGMEILFATPPDQRTESAQDIYLKEAYFELTLVKHLIQSLRTPNQEQP